MTETATMYPGGKGSVPIKTYPEMLEKEISNIVGKFSLPDIQKGALVIELLEYVTGKYGKKCN